MALELLVRILGDASQLSSSLQGATGKVEGFGGSALKTAAMVGGIAAVAGGAALAIADMTTAAAEDAQEQDHLTQAIANATGSTTDYTAEVDAAITAGQDKAFTDTEVRKGLEALIRTNGSVSKSTAQLALAQDIARAAGVDLETAANAVAKANAGQDGSLRKLLPGLAKGKTATDTLANAQKLAAGQSAKYASSTVGQQARIKDSFSELGETIGSAFLPAIDAILPALIPMMKQLSVLISAILPLLIPLIRAVAVVLGVMARALSTVVGWVISLVGWVKQAITWLGRIKVPKIELPFGIGKAVPAGAGTSAAGVAAFGATSSASSGGGASGGLVINISGALDPESTARQIRRILEGHATRTGALVAI